jgi:hypothetical protein
MQDRITSSYLHHLQSIYHHIDNRGIRASKSRLHEARIFVDQQISKNLSIASIQWNCHVFIGADNAVKDKNNPRFSDQVNLNATQGDKALLKKLQNIGYEVPKVTKKNNEGDYESKYSTCELALQKMLVANQYQFPGGDPAIRAILQVRELGKIKSSYLGCRYYQDEKGDFYYLTNYNVAGTLTGRRSSRKHTFGFGNNAQNFPKHGQLAKVFRKCLVARRGNIFLMVDQKSAEDWPVSALAQNHFALDQLQKGINRHCVRGSRVFGIPLLEPILDNQDKWKKDHFHEYYLGKKIGHANNYGMRGNRMSESLAQEGHSISPKDCQQLLDKANAIEPEIKQVFHRYIENEINSSRILHTPFGRERQFLGLRPNDQNYKILNEAYAYIPQSVVGDNTGFAVRYLECNCPIYNGCGSGIVQEGHDSIVMDIKDDIDTIWYYITQTISAFRRIIRFDNGIEVEIPIEAELGYDFDKTVQLHDLSRESLERAYAKIRTIREIELEEENRLKSEERLQQVVMAI